jgi:hypothetical protein
VELEEATEAGDMEFEFTSNKGGLDRGVLTQTLVKQFKQVVTEFVSK